MAKSKKAKEDREERTERDDPRTPVARDGAYVMMLFMTLVAIIAGTIFMYLDFDEYGQKPPPKPEQVTIQKLGDKAPVEAVAAPKAGDGGAPMGGMPMGGP